MMSRKSTCCLGWTSCFGEWGFSSEAMDGCSSLAVLATDLPKRTARSSFKWKCPKVLLARGIMRLLWCV